MTIQSSIIEALKASQSAHQAGLAEIQTLRTEKLTLQEKVATLEAKVASLQKESVKLVDPAAVQPLLEELARAVAATHAALAPMEAQPAPTAALEVAPKTEGMPSEFKAGTPAAMPKTDAEVPTSKIAPTASTPIDLAEFAKSVAVTQASASLQDGPSDEPVNIAANGQ